MLTKCKICGKTPPEEFKQTEPSEDGTPYGKIIDENLYFFINDGKKIAFCSPKCAARYTKEPSVAK